MDGVTNSKTVFNAVGLQRAACRAAVPAFVVPMILTVCVYGQPEQHWVEDPRPVSKAIEILETECRCVITYEDPLYTASQVEDATARVRRDGKSTSRVFVPTSHFFEFAHDHPAATVARRNIAPSVEALLAAVHQSGTASRFRVDRSDTVLHVVPERGSILQVAVSLPDTEGRADRMVFALLDAVNKATGAEIVVGNIPMAHMVRSTIRVTANKEPAQQVLTRILQATGRKVTWHLFYDYTLKSYFLNLSFVDPARCPATGPCSGKDLGDTLDAISIRNQKR